MPTFVVKLDQRTIADIPLRPGDMSIGRRPESDIYIDDQAVSAAHAMVFMLEGDSFIQDLKSTNGTFINNRRIFKHHLKHGDVVTIGRHELTYIEGEPATAACDELPARTEPKHPALFVLTGPGSGRRIDLTKPTTHLGKTGRGAGTINRTAQGYLLTEPGAKTPLLLNGKAVSPSGELLRSGDLIDLGESRFQFHFK